MEPHELGAARSTSPTASGFAADELQAVLDSLDDLIFVLDTEGVFTAFYQPVTHAQLYRPPEEFIGKVCEDVMPPSVAARLRQALAAIKTFGTAQEFEYSLPLDEDEQWFHAQLTPIRRGPLQLRAVAAVVRNISERKRLELDRERLIHELRQSLAHVKTLRGLIPICASCKKVRDDHGFWTHVEAYVQEHSHAEFSHGLCPACRERLYPDPDRDDPPR